MIVQCEDSTIMAKHSKPSLAKKEAPVSSDCSTTNVCIVCNKRFPSIYQMRIHQAEHTSATPKMGKKNAKSVLASTATVTALLNGNVSSSSKKSPKRISPQSSPGGRTVSCDLCNKQYKRVAQLQIHMSRAHTASKPFTCKVCSTGFTDKAAYKLHVSTHSTDLPYKCEECGETFQYSAYLESHRDTHSGANPFRCDYCSQRFSDNSSLKYHVMFNHSGETLYQCSTCTAKFTSNKEYNKHLQKCGKPTTAASDTDDSVLNLSGDEGQHYKPAKRKKLKKNPTLGKKRTKQPMKKSPSKSMTREDRQLEAALRQIEKMEEREARRAEELRSNEAVSDSYLSAKASPQRSNTISPNKHKVAASITKRAMKTSQKAGQKRALVNKKKPMSPKKPTRQVKTETLSDSKKASTTANVKPVPLTREERQMQAALKAIEKMEQRVSKQSSNRSRSSQSPSPSPVPTKKSRRRPASEQRSPSIASTTDYDQISVASTITDTTIRNVSPEPRAKAIKGTRTKKVKVKKSIATITVKETAKHSRNTQEDRQMAAALRTIERMENREKRRKAELESSEPSVQSRGKNDLLWLNGLRRDNDESSTDAASEHLTPAVVKKKKFTKKKPKNSKVTKPEVEVKPEVSTPPKRGRMRKEKVAMRPKLETQKSTVSSSTVYHGPASVTDTASPWQHDHRPIPAPGGLQDNVVMSREERQLAEAMKAIEKMEARDKTSKKNKPAPDPSPPPTPPPVKKTPGRKPKQATASSKQALPASKQLSRATTPSAKQSQKTAPPPSKSKLPDCIVRLTSENNSTKPGVQNTPIAQNVTKGQNTSVTENLVRGQNASETKRGRKKIRPPTDDEFSTSEEESEQNTPSPSPPKSSKSSVVDAATNSRGVWSIKETAMSGKRSEPRLEPEPPKMSREERKMAAIMAQFAKMT